MPATSREPKATSAPPPKSSFEQRIVVYFSEHRQLAPHRRVQHLAAIPLVGLTRHAVPDLRGVQVGQLPSEAFAEVGRREVIRIISLRHDGLVGLALACEVVVY